MADRITITLPHGLVADLDALAEEAGLSRSGIIREASARYVAEAHDAMAAKERRAAVDDTLALLERMRSLTPLDDRPTLEILREMRGPLDADIEDAGG
jgi:predicted DNA-binding protein